jgi:hypothetical protein
MPANTKMDKNSAYREIEENGGEPYALHFAEENPNHPLTPFCRRYLFEKDREARAAKDESDRTFALKSLAEMQSSSNIARVAAASSKQAADASKESAAAARNSAFWTMIAAIASAVGILVNAAINLGWLDWAKHVIK